MNTTTQKFEVPKKKQRKSNKALTSRSKKFLSLDVIKPKSPTNADIVEDFGNKFFN